MTMTAESSTAQEIDPRISRILNFFMDDARLERYRQEFLGRSNQPDFWNDQTRTLFSCYGFIRNYYYSLNQPMLVAKANSGMLYVSDNTAPEKQERVLKRECFDLKLLSSIEYNRTIEEHYQDCLSCEEEELKATIFEEKQKLRESLVKEKQKLRASIINLKQRWESNRSDIQAVLMWLIAIGDYHEILEHPMLKAPVDLLSHDGSLGERYFLENLEIFFRSSTHKTLDMSSSKSFQRAIFYVFSLYINRIELCAPLKDRISSAGKEYADLQKAIERNVTAMRMLMEVPHWDLETITSLLKILEKLKESKFLSLRNVDIVNKIFGKFSKIMTDVDCPDQPASVHDSFQELRKSFERKPAPIDNTSFLPKHLLIKKPTKPPRLSKKQQAAMRRKEKEKSIAESSAAHNPSTVLPMPSVPLTVTSSSSEMLTNMELLQTHATLPQSSSEIMIPPMKSDDHLPTPSSRTAKKKKKKQNRRERSQKASLLSTALSQQEFVAAERSSDLSNVIDLEQNRKEIILPAEASCQQNVIAEEISQNLPSTDFLTSNESASSLFLEPLSQQERPTEMTSVLSSERLEVSPTTPLMPSIEEDSIPQEEQSNNSPDPASSVAVLTAETNSFANEEMPSSPPSVPSSSETVPVSQELATLPEQIEDASQVTLEVVDQPDITTLQDQGFSTELNIKIRHLNASYLHWYQIMQQQVTLRQHVMMQHAEFSRWIAEQTKGQASAPPQDNMAGVLINLAWEQYYQQQYAQTHLWQNAHAGASSSQTFTPEAPPPYTIFVPEAITTIMTQLGPRCYLVGGATRNLLLGKRARDFDLVTDASEDVILSLGGKPVVSRYPGLYSLEIEVEPGVKTTVDIVRRDGILDTTLDANLRDFTVNAIYFDYKSGIFMPLSNSSYDLHDGIVRLIAKENDFSRIEKDPTLILRALSLVAHHGFQLEETLSRFLMNEGVKILWYAMQKNKKAIMDEVWKGFATGDALRFYQALQHFGYVSQLFPQARTNIGKAACNQSFENNLYNMLVNTSQLPPSKRSRKILLGRVLGCSEELSGLETRYSAVESEAFESQKQDRLSCRKTS